VVDLVQREQSKKTAEALLNKAWRQKAICGGIGTKNRKVSGFCGLFGTKAVKFYGQPKQHGREWRSRGIPSLVA
jgi:hypothetical protein